eukprot:CAMPEP_0170563530 /NCGR_PEP_ID=MMETSP0211-20121228/67223_1 /TAXON_ID=311385 /ORGANISM="Pseudokeronopsis sp., Strain OXSARD2" /LENGTH=68 /DNA_ID=CAMNT_0010881877 /DNA_START=23 /DNA_END=226 /DNA_ORIENTATION=+
MPLFSVSFPVVAQFFFKTLMDFVSFNVLELQMILPFLDFTYTDVYNRNFEEMGFGDMNVINNMGTMFL